MAGSKLPGSRDYSVLWIAAIEREFHAACTVLDEEYAKPPSDLADDDSTYTFGRIRTHNVVVARLTSMGTNNASAQITNTARSFPRLRFALLVGIAGGAPSEKDDVRLGDIVVSYPNAERNSGGVVQYQFGKTLQGQDFQRTGSLDKPPNVLLNAVNKLRDDYTRKGCHITGTVNELVRKNHPHFDGFSRPGPENDILYKPDFVHTSHVGDCNFPPDEEKMHLVQRKERAGNEPVVHHGIIGSADVVMKDALLRDRVAQRDGCICFEMEAAGVMNSDLKCLVIRGICDYADSHKNKLWQNYAAAAAAVYAKELLGVIRMKAVTKRETAFSTTAREVMPPRKQQDNSWGVAALLSYENMNDKRDYSSPGALHDFEWVWSTELVDWLGAGDMPYWISGKHASGKSMLTAYLAEAKQTMDVLNAGEAKYKTISFFFDYRVDGKLANSLEGMLRVLLFQLADKSIESKRRLEILLNEGRLQVDSIQNLFDALCDALTISEYKFCIFIDGLDEYDGNTVELLQKLQTLTARAQVKLCLSSRPEARVTDVFHIHNEPLLLQDHNWNSMYSYAERKILQVRLVNLDIEQQLPDYVIQALVEKSEGILLWFVLTLDELTDQRRTDEEVFDFIQNVQSGLNAIYEQVFSRIPERLRPEAALILLLIRELRELAVQEDFMGQSFSTTDLDHLWGAYDFIVDQLGAEMGIRLLSEPEELKTRVESLLRGLVEFQELEPEDHVFQGLTNQGVRYCHDTFDTFVHETSWIDENLPQQVKEKYAGKTVQYGNEFWLRLFTAMILQADKDGILSVEQQQEAFAELELIMRPWYQEGLNAQGAPFRWLKAIFGKRSSSSMLLAILKEICPLIEFYWTQPDKLPQDNKWVTKAYQWLISHSAVYEFPPQWKLRHVILRTAFMLYLELAERFEDAGESAFQVISPVMQSNLNLGLVFGSFMLQSDLQERAVLKMSQNPELRHVADLILAISHDIGLYFDDRVTRTALSSRQHEFIMQTILSRQNGWQLDVNEGFLKALKANGRLITSRDICSFLRDVWCATAATTYTQYILQYLDPTASPDDQAHAPDCEHGHKKRSSLLFHWAKLSCRTKSCLCGLPMIPSIEIVASEVSPVEMQVPDDAPKENVSRQATSSEYSTLLCLIFACSMEKDINCICYSGGTVLHAILDFNILYDSSIRGLDRKEKFLSLINFGIDPKIESKNGDALTAAREFKKKLRWKQRITPGWFASSAAVQDLMDIDFIIDKLEFYALHGRWAKDENGTFELMSPAVDDTLDVSAVHVKVQQELDGITEEKSTDSKPKKSPAMRLFRFSSNVSAPHEDVVSVVGDEEKKTPKLSFPRLRSASNTPKLETPDCMDSIDSHTSGTGKAIGLGDLMNEEQTKAFEDGGKRLSVDHSVTKKSTFRDLLNKSPKDGDGSHSLKNTPSLQGTPSLEHDEKSKRNSFFGGQKFFSHHHVEEPREIEHSKDIEAGDNARRETLPVVDRPTSTLSQARIAVSDDKEDSVQPEATVIESTDKGVDIQADKKGSRLSILGGFKTKLMKEK